jgi:hypothetical protein
MKWVTLKWILSCFENESDEMLVQLSESFTFDLASELEIVNFEGWNEIALYILMFLSSKCQSKKQAMTRILSIHIRECDLSNIASTFKFPSTLVHSVRAG